MTEGGGRLGSPRDGSPLTDPQSLSAGNRAVRVPGAEASAVDVSALWLSLLLGETTPFATFFRGIVSKTPGQEAPATASAFPMRVPYPQVYKKRLGGRASRPRRAEQQAVNLVVAALSWITLGSPFTCPNWLAAGAP